MVASDTKSREREDDRFRLRSGHPARPPGFPQSGHLSNQLRNFNSRIAAWKRGSLRKGSMSGSVFSNSSPASRKRIAVGGHPRCTDTHRRSRHQRCFSDERRPGESQWLRQLRGRWAFYAQLLERLLRCGDRGGRKLCHGPIRIQAIPSNARSCGPAAIAALIQTIRTMGHSATTDAVDSSGCTGSAPRANSLVE